MTNSLFLMSFFENWINYWVNGFDGLNSIKMFDLKKWPQTCQSFVFHVTWCQSCFVQLNSYQLTKRAIPSPIWRPPQLKYHLSCFAIIDESPLIFTTVQFSVKSTFFSFLPKKAKDCKSFVSNLNSIVRPKKFLVQNQAVWAQSRVMLKTQKRGFYETVFEPFQKSSFLSQNSNFLQLQNFRCLDITGSPSGTSLWGFPQKSFIMFGN